MKTQILLLLVLLLTSLSTIAAEKTYEYSATATLHQKVGDVAYAYRKVGKVSKVPLVLMTHFRASLDNWDPRLIDALAKERTVIAFDNKGVSGTTGNTPDSFSAMADDAYQFVTSLGYQKIDILGFSIGGAIAQELILRHPGLVEHAILAGTSPRGGVGLNTRDPKVVEVANHEKVQPEDFLFLFFEKTKSSQQAGKEFLKRRLFRSSDVDPESSAQTMNAQIKARMDWGSPSPDGASRLSSIQIPVLIANGAHDVMMPTPNSILLEQSLPRAQLIIYPDSGHGFLFQYADLFAEHVSTFLRSKAFEAVAK